MNNFRILSEEATEDGWKDSQKLMSNQLLEYRNSRQQSDLNFKDEDRVDDGC